MRDASGCVLFGYTHASAADLVHFPFILSSFQENAVHGLQGVKRISLESLLAS